MWPNPEEILNEKLHFFAVILQQATQLLLSVEDKVGLKIKAWRKMHVNYGIEPIHFLIL